jgi:ABC-type sugar transport system ATPase subunit
MSLLKKKRELSHVSQPYPEKRLIAKLKNISKTYGARTVL